MASPSEEKPNYSEKINRIIEALRAEILNELKSKGVVIADHTEPSRPDTSSLSEPDRQRAPRTKKCPESDTVFAKKMEYLKQFLDQDGKPMASFCAGKTLTCLRALLANLDSMHGCQHDDRKHRAKLMCHFCYLTKGNKKRATDCPHKNRTHHSRGLCKSCYQRTYYKVVTDLQADEEQIKEIIDKDGEEHKETAVYGKYIQIRDRSKRIGKKYERKRASA